MLCTVFIAVVFGGKSLYVSVCVCFVLLSYVVCYLLKSLYDVGYTMMVSRFVYTVMLSLRQGIAGCSRPSNSIVF